MRSGWPAKSTVAIKARWLPSRFSFPRILSCELGIEMIPAYSPQARGRGERSFQTWQGRLPQELRLAGIRDKDSANAFLNDHYIPEFNQKFAVTASQPGTAFVPVQHTNLDRVFCLQHERVVDQDNTVR